MDIKFKIGGGVCLGILVVLAILISMSFASLEFTEIGLHYNSFTKSIDNEPYTSGIYWVGPAGSFIVFPRTV